MKNVIKMVKKGGVCAAATGSAMFASTVVFAADHTAAINAAGTDGQTNTGAAVVVVLGIAAVVTGVGIVIKLLSR
ncbi:hypothetical protein [Thalassomonas sp. RHCl1]|uniref:hypothetical protein n=1 Tax=Thalassomonas sp. RHCl1 TaxID=2995320 RepID=UPI00248CCA5B|nr:hypothetical protein [Thalassomonas sp. RHCl1]